MDEIILDSYSLWTHSSFQIISMEKKGVLWCDILSVTYLFPSKNSKTRPKINHFSDVECPPNFVAPKNQLLRGVVSISWVALF